MPTRAPPPQRHDSTRLEIIFHTVNTAIYKVVNFSQCSGPWPLAPRSNKQKGCLLKQDKYSLSISVWGITAMRPDPYFTSKPNGRWAVSVPLLSISNKDMETDRHAGLKCPSTFRPWRFAMWESNSNVQMCHHGDLVINMQSSLLS